MKRKRDGGEGPGSDIIVGDEVVGCRVGTVIDGVGGKVVGVLGDGWKVKFYGIGKRRVKEGDIKKLVSEREISVVEREESTVAADVPAPPARSNIATELAPQIDGAALSLHYSEMGIHKLKDHVQNGSWELLTPTELAMKTLDNTANTAPWYRKAEAEGNYRKQAEKLGSKPHATVLEKVEGYREKANAVPIEPEYGVEEVLGSFAEDGNADDVDPSRITSMYTQYQGVWRRCVVFRKEDGYDKHPVWLLSRGTYGWQPDIRVGVVLIDREDLHTKSSKRMESDMRKAEIGEVTRVALTLGDIFPSPPAVERALIYFPQCFTSKKDVTPHRSYDAVSGKTNGPKTGQFGTKRIAVQQDIPYPPPPQYGHHPSWPEDSYKISTDVSTVFVPDTPTGGPLIGAPAWPKNAVCLECGKGIDPAAPGSVTGGLTRPSFIGRTDPMDRKKQQFLHTRTCVFAHKERTLCHIEFTWTLRGPKKKQELFVLPIDAMKNGCGTVEGTEWHVGEKGIIHLTRDDVQYQLLHFPSRKLIFLLAEDGKKMTGGFDEGGERPWGMVMKAAYAKEGSPGYIRMARQVLMRKAALKEKEERDAKMKLDQVVLEGEPEQVNVVELLNELSEDAVKVLDARSYILADRVVKHEVKRRVVSLESSKGSDEEEEEDDEASESDAETDEGLTEVESKMLRPTAEDEGDDDSQQRDIEDRYTGRRKYDLYTDGRDRTPTQLIPYFETLRMLEHCKDPTVTPALSNPAFYIQQFNTYFAENAGEIEGLEKDFPVIEPIDRTEEWVTLQHSWGAGLGDGYFTDRYITPPYQKVQGVERGACKAVAHMSKTDHEKLTLIECLLLMRSIERRRSRIIATKNQYIADTLPLCNELTKLYHEESMWLRPAQPWKHGSDELRVQAAAQLQVPESRLEVSNISKEAVVRVRGVQEMMRSSDVDTHAKEVTKEQSEQLLQLYTLGSLVRRDVGLFRGSKGKWVGAVGPAVTQLNTLLRGVYQPFEPMVQQHIDNKMHVTGQWVYEDHDVQKPLEGLLGKLPELHDGDDGECEVNKRIIERFITMEDDDDLSDDEEATARVTYHYAEYAEFNQLRIGIESGTYSGESTSIPIFKKSPVQRLVWDAKIRSTTVTEAIIHACKQSPLDHEPKISELYWMLLSADGDRKTGTEYPWRFHSLFKRFGLTKQQAIDLKKLVVKEVDEKIPKASKVEVDNHWRGLVRFKCHDAYVKLREAYPIDEDGMLLKRSKSAEWDELRMQNHNVFNDMASSSDEDDVSVETLEVADDIHETPSHGVDMHYSSMLNELLREIMTCDKIGRTAVLRALHGIRGTGGEQRYHWQNTVLTDNSQELAMKQSDAVKLARRIRAEVRKHMPTDLGDGVADSDKSSESSDWDDVSISDGSNAEPVEDVKDALADTKESDPFGKQASLERERLPACSITSCHRCATTLMNMYRYPNTVADALGKGPGHCVTLSKSSVFTDKQREYVTLLDEVVQAGVVWGKKKIANPSSLMTGKLKSEYKSAVESLWLSCAAIDTRDTYESQDEASDYSSEVCDLECDDESEKEYKEKHKTQDQVAHCATGLCKVWDLVCCVQEELTVTDQTLSQFSTFSFSLIGALQQGSVTADVVKVLDSIPRLKDMSKKDLKVRFDTRAALALLAKEPVGEAFAKFTQRNSTLVPNNVLIERLDEVWDHPQSTQAVAKACGATIAPPQLGLDLLPYHALYFNTCLGKVVGTHKAEDFPSALATAYKHKANYFTYMPKDGKVEIRELSDEEWVPADGVWSCLVIEHKSYEGSWVGWNALSDKIGGEETGEKQWERAEEMRRDPTDHLWRTLEQFEDLHEETAKMAWAEAGERVKDLEGGLYHKKGMAQDELNELFEARWLPYRKTFESFKDLAEYENTEGSSQEHWLTHSEFTARLGRRLGTKLWEEAEPRKLDKDTERPLTHGDFIDKMTRGMTKIWDALPELPVPTESHITPVQPQYVYMIALTRHATRELGMEKVGETPAQFARYACLKHPWVLGFQREMMDEAVFLPRIGDFTEQPNFMFTLKKGKSLKKFTHQAHKYFQKELGWNEKAFNLRFIVKHVPSTKINKDDALGSLKELRQVADQSRTLQKLFKARESSFPEAVFAIVSELVEGSMGAMTDIVTEKNFAEIRERLAQAGCRRLVNHIAKHLGQHNLKALLDGIAEQAFNLTVGNLLDSLVYYISASWVKPIQPASLTVAEEIAATSGWLMNNHTYEKLKGLLSLDGASGILDWAVRSMMVTHLPLHMHIRPVAQMVNVIKIEVTEVRYPTPSTAKNSNEALAKKLDWEYELYNDTKAFESDGTEGLDFFADMYEGHKVRGEMMRVKHSYDSTPTEVCSIIGGEAYSQNRISLKTVYIVTKKPVQLLSYRFKANSDLQPIAWTIKGALLPYDEARQLFNSGKDHVGDEVLAGHDMTYMHRFTERLTRPIGESDFVPQKKTFVGQWTPGDRVEYWKMESAEYGHWQKAMVCQVDEEGVPEVKCDSGFGYVTGPKKIRFAVPLQPNFDVFSKDYDPWFGTVPIVPKQWSAKVEISDVVPLIFIAEQAPTVAPEFTPAMNWPDIVTYQNPDAVEGGIATIRIGTGNEFTLTRKGNAENLSFEWGIMSHNDGAIQFRVDHEGIPGDAKPPNRPAYSGLLENLGKELTISGTKLERVDAGKIFLHGSVADESVREFYWEWNHFGGYTLMKDRHNGQPVYSKTDEMSFLFVDNSGRWVVSLTVGGPPLLKSEETCDFPPGFCQFMLPVNGGGWELTPAIFFVTAPVELNLAHLHQQLTRLGIDPQHMNELGFDADDYDEAQRELHNQLDLRRIGEAQVCDAWDGIRADIGQMYRTVHRWFDETTKKTEKLTAPDGGKIQALWCSIDKIETKVTDLMRQDEELLQHQLESDEDDAISAAAYHLATTLNYPQSLVAEWARNIRVSEGCLYHPDRSDIMNAHFTRYGQSTHPKMSDVSFKRDSEKKLREIEAYLWTRDFWLPHLYAMTTEVLLDDRERSEYFQKSGLPDHPSLSEDRVKLQGIVRRIKDWTLAKEKREVEESPWWRFVEERHYKPLNELVLMMIRYFDFDERKNVIRMDRADETLHVFRNAKRTPFEKQKTMIEADCEAIRKSLTSTCGATTDIMINWDEASPNLHLPPLPLSSIELVHYQRRRLALRWPPCFSLTTKYGAPFTVDRLRKARCKESQLYKDGIIMVKDGINKSKQVLGPIRWRQYLRHRAAADKAAGKKRTDVKLYEKSGMRRRLRMAWRKSICAKRARAAYRTTEAYRISKKDAKKSEAAKKAKAVWKKQYSKTEEARRKKREYNRVYRQTDEGKAKLQMLRQSAKAQEAKKAYRESEKAKEAKKAYRESEKAKEAKKAYNQTEKAKEAKKAYRQTEKAKEAKIAYRQNKKQKTELSYEERRKAERLAAEDAREARRIQDEFAKDKDQDEIRKIMKRPAAGDKKKAKKARKE